MATTTSTTTVDTPATPVKLSAKIVRAIDSVRGPFVTFTQDYSALAVRREELAPKFMKAFAAWQAETAGSFIDFIRVLVPDVPGDREGYRAHRAYQAADYLRRLTAQAARVGTTATERAERITNAPVNPARALARLMASLLPLVSEGGVESIWKAVEENLHWSERQVARLQTLVEEESPLVKFRAPRGVHIDHTLNASVVAAPVEEGSHAATVAA